MKEQTILRLFPCLLCAEKPYSIRCIGGGPRPKCPFFFCCYPQALLVRWAEPEAHAEKLLMANVLRRAAYDHVLYKRTRKLRDKLTWKDAYIWLFDPSPEEDDYLMSCNNICRMLDRDIEEIRVSARKMKRQDIKKCDMVDTHGRV